MIQSIIFWTSVLLLANDAYIGNSYIKGVISWGIKLSLIFWNRKSFDVLRNYTADMFNSNVNDELKMFFPVQKDNLFQLFEFWA